MSAPSTHPPIPRQPIGTTFIVSISVLGLFAAVQMLALLWHYGPLVRKEVAESAAQARLAQQQAAQQAQVQVQAQAPAAQPPSD
ncbi:MAG TPA: hypothetical protein PLS03_15610, partial [Terrimicrobiaceae bacterium]|nr:hypothetical protein [Terrimicrobiaceae bacterium]